MKRIKFYLLSVMAILLTHGCALNAGGTDANDPAAKFLGQWASPDALGTLEVIRDENGLGLRPDAFMVDIIRLEQKEGCLHALESESSFIVKICPVSDDAGDDDKLILEAGEQQIHLQRVDVDSLKN